MKTVTFDTRQMVEDRPTGQILFVTVAHPQIAEPVHLVTDGVDYLFKGVLWHRAWLKLKIVSDGKSPPALDFSFPNTVPAKVAQLQHVSEPATVSFEMVPAAYFDRTADPRTVLPGKTPEAVATAEELLLVNVEMAGAEVKGTLRNEDYRQLTYPKQRATEALLPGVHVA